MAEKKKKDEVVGVITKEEGLKLGMSLEKSFWMKPLKKPDMLIREQQDGAVIFQIEVISNNDRNTTVLKLAYGLIDQLRYSKNCSSEVNEICGFIVPVDSGFVELVACEWSDRELKFTITQKELTSREVLPKVKYIYNRQKEYKPKGSKTSFTFPLSRSYVTQILDESAHQLKSSQSVVLASPSTNRIYKSPLVEREALRLLGFVVDGLYLRLSALPILTKKFDHDTYYFEFKQYKPPLTRADAKVTSYHLYTKL